MDKNAIKKYAIWARNELISRVTQKAEQYEITEKKTAPADVDSIRGKLLTETEKKQRKALIEKIKVDGFEQAMEEVAYTWFNRFTALRFMEVNNYLPSHTRVFTNEAGEFKPQILADAISLEMDGLDLDKVYELKDRNKTEELYKYLLIVQCNALSKILPGMFQKIADYTELLLPDYLLREGSVIEQMISLIPEDDWTDQVQIIGWLYQYYNTEPKDKVFANLKDNIKISKENIPAATQLFTPDWIVRYMVENSLGRLWLEGHPNDALKSEWKYYLDEAEQEPEVQAQLDEIRKEYAALKPEDIRCIDPCAGSGHILCYLFDVLVQIYEDYGYTAREAVASIVENNLWGLDIDARAAQLAYFSVMMKARQYDRRFFSRGIQPHVYAIKESNGITPSVLNALGTNLSEKEHAEAVKQATRLAEEMHDAKEYGSIIHVTPCDWDLLRRFAVLNYENRQMRLDVSGEIEAAVRLQDLINVGEALARTYDVVVTNPPYMGGGNMRARLSEFVKKNYPDSKSDLFAVFIEKCGKMTKENGYQAMITQHAWMFLSSFEKLRGKLQQVDTVNMAHLGARAFEEIGGEVVQTTSFVMRKNHVADYKGTYCRLIEPTTQRGKEDMFLEGDNRYAAQQDNFSKIPGSPVAYWVSEKFIAIFSQDRVADFAEAQEGLKTGDNERFIRQWYEVEINNTNIYGDNSKKWVFHTKGGDYRKWSGNKTELLNYDNNGQELKAFKGASLTGMQNYFLPCITYNRISSAKTSFRYAGKNSIPNMAGLSLYPHNNEAILYLLGWLNSDIVCKILSIINPTLNFPPGTIGKLPMNVDVLHKAQVDDYVQLNIDLSKTDWDAFETSWDFQRHPLVRLSRNLWDSTSIGIYMMHYYEKRPEVSCPLELCYLLWQGECNERFNKLKENEEELNRIFIDIYGLQDELTPEVEDKDVTVHRIFDSKDEVPESMKGSNYVRTKRDEIVSLISYAVGCMFGRYSLDVDGLAYAGGEWDASKYVTFQPDKDAILPICDDEYFEDDIVGRFVEFIETVYGKDTLEENLQFIADALGGKGTSREVIRSYFMSGFYADHCRTYQKRPIYWLFDSGKRNGFKCLIYMHRYRPDTIARIRTDYVHEQQSRYRTAITNLENRINNAGTSERVKLNKQLTKLQAQADELRVYEEKIHHLADQMIAIDLDDGVKVNYAKFQDVLAKIGKL